VLVKTAGNALRAVPRQDLLMQNNNNNNNSPAEATTVVLSVVVPPNMKSGDALHVQAPDGRIIAVTIPPGIYPGQSFMVKVPSPQQQQQQPQQQPSVFTPPAASPPTDSIPFSQALNSSVYATTNSTPAVTSSNSAWSHTMSNMFSQHPPPSNSNNTRTTAAAAAGSAEDSNDDDLILVQVPAGYGPGSKLHVQVPDGSLVEATVPPGNVQEFYMRLPPRRHSTMPVARPIFP
jgi:hypothetical protein